MDLTEADDIKKRWQEYTEQYKKDLNDPDNHNGVITCLEPDILEFEVKWALKATLRTKVVEVAYFHLFSLIIHFTSVTDKLWKFKLCRELSISEQHLWHSFIFDVIRSTRDFLKGLLSSPKE